MPEEIPPRPNGRPHLSECYLLTGYPEAFCTCDDYSPEADSD